jgi:hypothetical protein
MKSKFYRSLSLLLVTVLASASVIAQPGWGKDDSRKNDGYNNRRYGNDDNDRWDDRNDDRRDDKYGKGTSYGGYKNQDGYYENGRYIIRHKLKEPRYNPGRRPSSYHVWVDGEWIYTRGEYRYQPGYWTRPARGMQYVAGHWEIARKGWYWEPGYWARPNNRW